MDINSNIATQVVEPSDKQINCDISHYIDIEQTNGHQTANKSNSVTDCISKSPQYLNTQIVVDTNSQKDTYDNQLTFIDKSAYNPQNHQIVQQLDRLPAISGVKDQFQQETSVRQQQNAYEHINQQEQLAISNNKQSPCKRVQIYGNMQTNLTQKYPIEFMLQRQKQERQQQTHIRQQVTSIKQQKDLIQQSEQLVNDLPLDIQNSDKTQQIAAVSQLLQESDNIHDKQPSLCNRNYQSTIVQKNGDINTITARYNKIMEEDFIRFTSHRRCLNNTNIYLSYIFHLLQSLGIFTTTLSSTFAQRELIWVGVFLNCAASLIYIYEQLNNKISYKLQQNILAIMQNEYQGEIQLIEPQQDLNISQNKKPQDNEHNPY